MNGAHDLFYHNAGVRRENEWGFLLIRFVYYVIMTRKSPNQEIRKSANQERRIAEEEGKPQSVPVILEKPKTRKKQIQKKPKPEKQSKDIQCSHIIMPHSLIME